MVGADNPAEFLDRRNCFQRARDDLAGAGALGFFRQTSLQQFGVRENHAELVIQLVEHLGQVARQLSWLSLPRNRIVRRHD